MPNYAVAGNAAAGTNLPIFNLTGSASVRLGLFFIVVGSSATPADVATRLQIIRTTDVGVGGTALTEEKLDPLSATPIGAAIQGTFTTVPTKSGSALLELALNQRVTYQWFAVNERAAIISAAAAANGLELESISSGGTPTQNATEHWYE